MIIPTASDSHEQHHDEYEDLHLSIVRLSVGQCDEQYEETVGRLLRNPREFGHKDTIT